MRKRVVEALREEIAGAGYEPGARLPSHKALARQFGVSHFVVMKAVAELEGEGLLERRHGSGTYVREARPGLARGDMPVLFMSTGGHLFHDFYAALCRALHAEGLLPVTLDSNYVDKRAMLDRTAASGHDLFVVHGNVQFPYELLDTPAWQSKHIVAVIQWVSACHDNQVHRVVTDHERGGELVAEHLWAKGHRTVLVVGLEYMLGDMENPDLVNTHGKAFREAWLRRGGELAFLASTTQPDKVHVALDRPALFAALAAKDGPTAVFGLRDVEAHAVQTALLQESPQHLARTPILGYGNTPWSQGAQPPLSTVDWNLAEVAGACVRLVSSLRRGVAIPPALTRIEPRLVLR